MASYTSNYNLKKPADTDFYDVADFNGNSDIIDTALNSKLEKDLSNISGGAVPVANGGTGASTVDNARNNLGLGTNDTVAFRNIELSSDFPYVDFHYNMSSDDYNVRIINDANNILHIGAYSGNAEVQINNNTILTTASNDYNIRALGLNGTNIDTDYDRNYTTGISDDNHGTRPRGQWQNIFNINGAHFKAQIAIENNNSPGSSDINMFFRSQYFDQGWTNWVCVTKVFVQSSQPTNVVDGSLWAW